MERIVQAYVTDIWGSHSSRSNLGVYSHEDLAIKTIFYEMLERDQGCLKEIFVDKATRFFIELIAVDEYEGYQSGYDSENDDHIDYMKAHLMLCAINRTPGLDLLEQIFKGVEQDDYDQNEYKKLCSEISEASEALEFPHGFYEVFMNEDTIKNTLDIIFKAVNYKRNEV